MLALGPWAGPCWEAALPLSRSRLQILHRQTLLALQKGRLHRCQQASSVRIRETWGASKFPNQPRKKVLLIGLILRLMKQPGWCWRCNMLCVSRMEEMSPGCREEREGLENLFSCSAFAFVLCAVSELKSVPLLGLFTACFTHRASFLLRSSVRLEERRHC